MKQNRFSTSLILLLIILPLLFLSLAMAGFDELVAEQGAGQKTAAEPIIALEPRTFPAAVYSPNTPPPPYGPVGTVKDHGANVANGTAVTASCGGVVYAQTTTVNTLDPVESWYDLIIPGDDPVQPGNQGCTPGQTIVFTIGGQTAYQTVPFVPGSGLLELTLDEPAPQVDLEKFTLGENADTPPGPTLAVSSTVTWTYNLVNNGNVTLVGVELWDDEGTPGDDADDRMVCSYSRLAPDDPQECSLTGTVALGQFVNVATVGGTFTSTNYTDSDSSHYLGVQPALTMEKLTNGQDADTEPGPSITAGDPITWTYIVTNTGNVTLTAIKVMDDNGTPQDTGDDQEVCTIASLAPSISDSCQWTGTTAVVGQYGNIGSASSIIGSLIVTASDPSHYLGQADTQYLYLPAVIK